jgi:hypothetical protein
MQQTPCNRFPGEQLRLEKSPLQTTINAYIFITYLLTARSRILLEQLNIFQQVMKIPAFLGTRMFNNSLQEPVTCPYTKADLSSLWPLIENPNDASFYINVKMAISILATYGVPIFCILVLLFNVARFIDENICQRNFYKQLFLCD